MKFSQKLSAAKPLSPGSIEQKKILRIPSQTFWYLFTVIDESNFWFSTNLSESTMDRASYRFIALFILMIEEKRTTIQKHFSVPADQNLLLDSKAPRSICCKEWLQEAKLDAFEEELPTSKLLLWFAKARVSARYGIQISETVSKIQEKVHTLRLVYYVPSIPVLFRLVSHISVNLGFTDLYLSGILAFPESMLSIRSFH